MAASRTGRAFVFAALVAASLVLFHQSAGVFAQVPSAADPPRYVQPAPNIVQVFDAELLPQTLVSPNRQL
ncbi:MAG: hypothetical protein JF610_02865, partial [Acidobacteria bacterium]|nr:hypothetical protein [Acidobacteriota bacterium]